MLHWARRLSAGFPFVRVDLYAVDGQLVFDEMTWHPEGGGSSFTPASYDHYRGERIPLPVATHDLE